jgi:prepilin-type N-terminal cleavage/methylation domain-containing protein
MEPVRSDRASGFTLVELLVAMALVAIVAAGSALLTGMATRAILRSRVETIAVIAAQERLEQLRGLAWGYGSGHEVVAAEDTTTDLSGAAPAAGGRGLAAAPAGALDADTSGYVDYLGPTGRWIAAGMSPPAGTRFIRRWSVERPAGRPDLVVLRVRVLDVLSHVPPLELATARARTSS